MWSQLIHAITQTESLDEIYEAALDALAAGLGVRRASVLLFDPDGTMRFKRVARVVRRLPRRGRRAHAVAAARKGRSAIYVDNVNDDASLAAFLPVFRQEGIAALGFIPLEGADGVIGKFMLYYGEPHTFTPDELEFAGLVAVQVAFAVERAHAHQKIRESAGASQRLAAIVESSDDAILSKDLNGIIMSWNRGAERMFGYSAAEVIGQSIAIIIPPDRLFEEDQVLARIRAGQPVEMETVRRRKDGTSVDISLKVSPVKDDEGHIVGASKIARDITARRRSEAERADLLDEVRRERNAAESARRQAAFLAEAGFGALEVARLRADVRRGRAPRRSRDRGLVRRGHRRQGWRPAAAHPHPHRPGEGSGGARSWPAVPAGSEPSRRDDGRDSKREAGDDGERPARVARGLGAR